jgi:hypothetical protein
MLHRYGNITAIFQNTRRNKITRGGKGYKLLKYAYCQEFKERIGIWVKI